MRMFERIVCRLRLLGILGGLVGWTVGLSPAGATPLVPPSPPSGLSAVGVADDAIQLDWSHDGENLLRFVIYRASNVEGPYQRLTATPKNRRTYTDVDLAADTQYCYRVEAENNDGAASSPPVCARTLAPRPDPPTNVQAGQVQGSPFIDITWQHADGASIRFVLYRQRVPGDAFPTAVDTTSNLAYRDGGAKNGVQVCYTVTALSLSGESIPSGQACVTPVITQAELPTGVTAAAISSSAISLSWRLPVYNYSVLRLERADDGAAYQVAAEFTVETITYTDRDLGADTEYCYRFQSINEVSQSAYSVPVCVRTGFARPETPTLVEVEVLGADSLKVRWEAPLLPNHAFRVWRRLPTGSFEPVAEAVDSLWFVDTGLAELTRYCYAVQAYNPAFESNRSAETCAQTTIARPTPVGVLLVAPDPASPTTALTVEWTESTPSFLTFYELAYREQDGEWIPLESTEGTSADLGGLLDATWYEVRVAAVRQSGTDIARSDTVAASARTFLAHWAGDTNGDGSVTAADVVYLTSPGIFGETTSFASDGSDVSWKLRAVELGQEEPGVMRSDTDRSGVVDLFDFLAIAANAGRSAPGAGGIVSARIASSEQAATLASLLDGFVPGTAEQEVLRAELAEMLASSTAGELPDRLTLWQNYPNPFNPATAFEFYLPKQGDVRVSVHNTLGQTVAILLDRTLEAGRHAYRFDATGLPSGHYLLVLEAGSERQTRTMTLLR